MNPTNEHREQARAIMYDGFEPQAGSLGLDSKAVRRRIDMIASALSSRDAEVREVLAGLIHHYVRSNDGSVIQHWCQKGRDGYFECHTDCLAARDLYTKLQPKESGG